ncbi:MAG: sensor histidine kinase [Myxococcota bacterium]
MKLSLGLPHGTEASVLGRRLTTLTLLRLVFLSALLGILGRWHLREVQWRAFSVQVALIALAFGFALAGIYAIVLRSGRHYNGLAYTQLFFDQLTWTVLAYLTGGANSGATSLYGLTVLTGATVGGLFAAATAAGMGMAMYTALCLLMITGLLGPPPDQLDVPYATTIPATVGPFALNSLVLLVVTLLAGFLAERLRLTGGKLEEATERALQAERLAYLGKVAAGLAHEIRNPLGSISASIELLRDAPGLAEDDRHLCDIIHSESSRLNDLVSDMLNLAKPKKPDIARVDLTSAAREVVTLARRSGRGAQDVDVVTIAPETPVPIEADPAQLRQLLWNLVRNAVQATAPNTQVSIEVVASEHGVTFQVTDHGQGINDEVREHLFEAFFSTRSRGAGIGLAVVKRIADDHGWKVEVESKEGVGTTFRVLATTPKP